MSRGKLSAPRRWRERNFYGAETSTDPLDMGAHAFAGGEVPTLRQQVQNNCGDGANVCEPGLKEPDGFSKAVVEHNAPHFVECESFLFWCVSAGNCNSKRPDD